jgi:hypothetical protein
VNEARPCREQRLNRVREVLAGDVMAAVLDAQAVRLHQDIDRAETFGGFVARESTLRPLGSCR